MIILEYNDVKVYDLTSGKKLPDWLSERKRRKLVQVDDELKRRIELLQDFEMPISSNCIKVTPDGQNIIATGIYKPKLKCFDVNQLSLKFERYMDSETVKFNVLTEDYSKLVLLGKDRKLEFHSKSGAYEKVRLPKHGRDMLYMDVNCDVLVASSSNEIYRFNLELGQFLTPYYLRKCNGNSLAVNKSHQLISCGTDEGIVCCFDPRVKAQIASLNLKEVNYRLNGSRSLFEETPAISTISFRDDMVTMGVGTSNGKIMLFDLRSSLPTIVKDHNYGDPIKKIMFLNSSDCINNGEWTLSADKHCIKIWDKNTCKMLTTVPSEHEINDFDIYPNSGLIFGACEGNKMSVFYIPSMGIAPKWCSFLDNITEELEEVENQPIYENYKFMSKDELISMGLDHLIGTEFLRAHMHGYFIDERLYEKIKISNEPSNFDHIRKKKVQDKISRERSARIKILKLPKINKLLAENLLQNNRNITNKDLINPLKDDRFSKLFSDSAFEIDKDNENFKLVSYLNKKKSKKLIDSTQNETDENFIINQEMFDNEINENMDERNDFNYRLTAFEDGLNINHKDSLTTVKLAERLKIETPSNDLSNINQSSLFSKNGLTVNLPPKRIRRKDRKIKADSVPRKRSAGSLLSKKGRTYQRN